MEEFIAKLPKIELHAHLNGSLSQDTLKKLGVTYTLDDTDLSHFFTLFKDIYAATDTKEKITFAASCTIEEFKQDGVVYLELRSTPRSSDKMTMEEYVLGLLESKYSGIIVNYILSMDRRFPIEKNRMILDLAIKYRKMGVVGIDICGDPHQGDLRQLIDLLLEAKKHNLRITIHLGEIPNQNEIIEILKLKPDRIGHGTFLGDSNIKSLGIPLEICLSSNLACKIVSCLDNHHFKDFHLDDHPVVLCTDDKGIFNTSLSKEYQLASQAFNLNMHDIFTLALKAVDYIFDTDDVKKDLQDKFMNFQVIQK